MGFYKPTEGSPLRIYVGEERMSAQRFHLLPSAWAHGKGPGMYHTNASCLVEEPELSPRLASAELCQQSTVDHCPACLELEWGPGKLRNHWEEGLLIFFKFVVHIPSPNSSKTCFSHQRLTNAWNIWVECMKPDSIVCLFHNEVPRMKENRVNLEGSRLQ